MKKTQALDNFVKSFESDTPVQPQQTESKGTLDRNWQMKKQGILNQFSQMNQMNGGVV